MTASNLSKRSAALAIGGLALLLLQGCGTDDTYNYAGTTTQYKSINESGPVGGIGMQANDITAMTDKMVRDLLSTPALVNRPTPPRIIVDSQYFTNEGSSPVNKNLLTDRLRSNLLRASQGRLVFVARSSIDVVEKERALKRQGTVDSGTIRSTQATAGADFRLVGRIATRDAVDQSTGMKQRYTQVTFELIDLEYGTLIWSNQYEYQKAAQDDIVYR